jgi:hypothetical protein
MCMLHAHGCIHTAERKLVKAYALLTHIQVCAWEVHQCPLRVCWNSHFITS